MPPLSMPPYLNQLESNQDIVRSAYVCVTVGCTFESGSDLDAANHLISNVTHEIRCYYTHVDA